MQSLLESSLYHSLLTGNPLSLFYLSIICIRPVFPVVMFILQFLRCRFTAACHLRHLFKYNCIMNRLMCVFSPCERTMILTQHCRNSFIIKIFKIICDQHACILFIRFFDLIPCQIPHARNFSVNIICMGCAQLVAHSECVCTITPISGNSL